MKKNKEPIIGISVSFREFTKWHEFQATDLGGEDTPLFNIPPNQIIVPCLHIFLGIEQRLIATLEIELQKLDYNKLSPEKYNQYEENQAAISKKSEEMKNFLLSKESELKQLNLEIDGLQQLHDHIFDILKFNPFLIKAKEQGGYQMPFCVTCWLCY